MLSRIAPTDDEDDGQPDGWERYLPPPDGFDEATAMPSLRNDCRSHWQPFRDSLQELGLPEFKRRWTDAQHLIRDNGVTYNVYGDPRGISRPWQLDPIPLLIPAHEAKQIEAGLTQRALLLEMVARDLYGPQQLLKEGLLPAHLLFPNPGFLRPCHGVEWPGGRYLHMYAANLGRASDGRWHVIGDRTQAPSGAGYALENRIVMTRTLPEAFRNCRVHRLALFFQAFRETLRAIAPRNKDNPRVVLLTPGPYNETYFEHAYLARYLGYTLVQGGDLTIRDNQVFLKVLGGLQRVDVIFRRLDDDFCDPLELRADSFLGVPGLMHAARSGNVAIANALGTGLLETPALLAYLPRLAQRFLGQDLLLPSVPTWWCGEREGLAYVLDHLSELILKPAFPGANMDPVFPYELSSEGKSELVAKMNKRPWEFVAQARVDLSSTPVFVDGRLEPRKLVLRTYLTPKDDAYIAMPGGLTRVSGSADTVVVSMQRGGGSKDTWVLADGPVSDFSLLSARSRVELTRAGGDLPSRAADNLFWLGRYAERAEGITRLLRGISVRLAERSGLAESPELPALLRTLAIQRDAQAKISLVLDPEAHINQAVFDLNQPGSLTSVLRSLRRVASIVRDLISIDMWRVLNGLSDFPTDIKKSYGADGPTPGDILDLLNQTVLTLAAFGGLATESMTRAHGWRFLDMGRRLERAMNMIALLKGTMMSPAVEEAPTLDAVLEVADSGMTYRRRYLSSLQAEAVLDLLVFDEANPRSLAAQLVALEDDVNHLPQASQGAGRPAEQRFAIAALSSVRTSEPERLAAIEDGTRPLLAELLEHVGGWLPIISDSITQHYLSHLQTSRHLAQQEPVLRTALEMGDSL